MTGEKVSKQTVVIVCTGILAFLSLSLAIFTNDLVFLILYALIGGVQGMIFPAASVLVAESVHPSRSVLANPIFYLGIDLSQGVSPLILSFVAVANGLQYTFLACAAISLVATLALLVIRNRKK